MLLSALCLLFSLKTLLLTYMASLPDPSKPENRYCEVRKGASVAVKAPCLAPHLPCPSPALPELTYGFTRTQPTGSEGPVTASLLCHLLGSGVPGWLVNGNPGCIPEAVARRD